MKPFEIMEALTDMDDDLVLRSEMGTCRRGVCKGKPTYFRWCGRIAAVIAVIMMMTVTVFAADVVWNEGTLFSVFFGGVMSHDETALAGDIGKTFGESVTSNGATITLLEGVADENTYWLHLRAEAPEGTALPDLQMDEPYFYYFSNKAFKNARIQRINTADGQGSDLELGYTVTPLPDNDPTDHVKEFVVIFWATEGDAFSKPGQLLLEIPGLYIHKGKDPYLQTLFTGNFAFDISFDHEKIEERKVVVDTGSVSFYNEEYDYTTTVTEVTISPLHIDITYSCTSPNNKYIFPYGGPVQLVMKDGTTVDAQEAYFDARTQTVVDPNDVAGPRLTCFDMPIVVENIDYIIVGDVYIFDVN